MSRLKITLYVLIIAVFIAGGVFLVIILKGDDILIVPEEYASISEAMAKAKEGYTVLLMSGNYNESVVLKSGVTLKGEEGQEVVVSCENNKAAITVQDCNNVVIENIGVEYIENDIAEPNDGIFIKDSNVKVLTCRAEKCKNGINIDGNSKVEIIEFTGSNNTKFGVFASNEASVSVSDSVFEDNGLTGIAAFGGTELRIENCISSGHKHGGFESKNTECTFIKDSRAAENDWGIAIYAKKAKYQTPGSYAEVTGTTATDNNDYGISISGREVAVLADNISRGNGKNGISVYNIMFSDISNNISFDNGRNGISCYRLKEAIYSGREAKVQMINNVSKGNTHDGISVSNITTAEVRDNISYSNRRFGFACYQSAEEAVEGTTIDLWGNAAISNGRNGISCSMFHVVQAVDNRCQGNKRSGIGLERPLQAKVEGNICEDNGACGLTVQKENGQVVLSDNICRQNLTVGILVMNSENCMIENNKCERNNTGISISEITNTAIVNSNICSENKKYGINCHNVKEVEIFENECSNNKQDGITVWTEEKNKSNERVSDTETLNTKETIAKVHSNKCLRNADGIDCQNIKKVYVFENECRNNKKNGILVWSRKKGKSDKNTLGIATLNKEQATGEVHSNNCSGNGEDGIFCKGLDEVEVFENECILNKYNGIAMESDTGGKIRWNVCQENFKRGISLYNIKRKIAVEDNECGRNGLSGLRLRKSTSAEVSVADNVFSENFFHGMYINEGSKAKVIGNMCEYNRYEGLYAGDEGTEVDAVNNTFKGNYATGILYSKGASGTIDSNICVNHPWSGITIRDEETRVIISNNTIGGNDCWGIAYLRGGGAELRDNTFQGNGIGSIRTESGTSPAMLFGTYIYLMFGLLFCPYF